MALTYSHHQTTYTTQPSSFLAFLVDVTSTLSVGLKNTLLVHLTLKVSIESCLDRNYVEIYNINKSFIQHFFGWGLVNLCKNLQRN